MPYPSPKHSARPTANAAQLPEKQAMNDESNALRKFSPLEIWFSWQHSSLQDSPMFCNAEAALAQIESLTREKAKLVASRDAYKRDAEGLLYVGRATVDALETTEAEVKTLRSELDAAKRNVAAKYFFFLQNRGETDETTRQLHELVKLLNKDSIRAHGARCG